ncbi:hypothetical protein BDP27DRAFT_1342044 [Rhodocollybia butyracea]|uniref:Uncharacterized protein n=1 Tax=Rhodocollybia butyracea TaxID=206335 RepID=A0A9P5P898_9AGAR|nr:hypothetical protein BDP27DRAFT_1342044 [Rhodocollybia butyracea]
MACFTCWPKRASLIPSLGDEVISGNVTKRQKQELRNDNDNLGSPSKGEYARETGKMFLEALDIAAKQMSLPGVVTVIELAKILVQTCEDSYATLKHAKELKDRIENLTLILVNELKGKQPEGIEERLWKDIEQLEQDLKYIKSKLDEIAKQNAFLLILFRWLNKNKVQECVERLGNALESFHLARQIADADALENLSQQIITFYTQQAPVVGDIQEDVKGMKTALAILTASKEGNCSSLPRGIIPDAPNIFFGRDAIVDDFPENNMARICLLGPGGMGKTSIARAVLNHQSIIEYFGKGNRVWVPCVKATSVSLLQDTLYGSLGVSLNTGNTLHDIIHDLKSLKSPIILLLDNFETPWNLHSRMEVQDVLLQLEKLEHVALFVTMRSSQPPGDSIHWESVHLKAVDEEASILIYAGIDPAGSQSPELALLLDEVGHMPLAITLMAKLGKNLGSTPADLLEQYKQGGTTVMNLGRSAEQSMDICIGLSAESQPMKDSPSAAKLLAVLALLPVGTTLKALSQWWARDTVPHATIMSGLGTLLDTSLVEKRADNFVVLPVIRRYVLDPMRFPENIRESTVQMACAFLKEHNASKGENNYLAHKTARSLEEANLQGILLETTATHPDIIEALLVLSEHQYETRPRLEIAQHALELSKKSQDQKLYGEALYWNGRNLFGLAQFEEAIKQFDLARAAFLQVSEPKRAADALYWAGHASFPTSSPNHQDVQKALEEFQSLADPAGIAKCQMSHFLASQWDAQSILTLAATWEFCISNNLLLEQAICTWNLTKTCINLGRFDEAKQWGDYDKAVKYLMEGLERSKAYGSALSIAQILFQLGRAWMKKGQKEDAQGAFTETLKYSEMLQGSWQEPQYRRACRFYLDKLENPSREPNSQERKDLRALGAKEDYETLGFSELDRQWALDTTSG